MDEEDLKILIKRLIKRCDECKLNECINCEISYSDIQTIKHLIQEYKDLKEIEESHRKENGELRERVKELEEENEDLKNIANNKQWISPCYVAQNYISKSLVEEKIEEYTKLLKNCNRFSDIDRIKAINERILELQELIEKER